MRIVILYSIILSAVFCGCSSKPGKPWLNHHDPYKPVMVITGSNIPGDQQVSGLFAYTGGSLSKQSVQLKSERRHDSLFLQPVFGLGAGMQFEWQVYMGGDTLRYSFKTPEHVTSGPKAAIAAIYPLSDTIPSNTLIFHVCFSIPMSEDLSAFKKVRLLDENGQEKAFAWREKSGWTDSGRHLVLMVHPGRIKRGIHYAEREGVLFEEGHRYTLEIGNGLKDRSGHTLPETYRKTFFIKDPDRISPALSLRMQGIEAGTRQPLLLNFSEAMDYGTMQIGCSIMDKSDMPVNGRLVSDDDKSWQFIPDKPWQRGAYQLVLNDYITDLASNHLYRRFEEQQLDAAQKRNSLKLPFQIK